MPPERHPRPAPASPRPRRAPSTGRSGRRRELDGPASVEAYIRAQSPPRYMQRLREIEIGYADHVRRLGEAYRAVEDESGGDPELFERTWSARARTWRFDGLNELIRDHNAYFPIESNLPMDPRTQDYVRVRGASYRRRELGPSWVLEYFPAAAAARSAGRPAPPRLPPREP